MGLDGASAILVSACPVAETAEARTIDTSAIAARGRKFFIAFTYRYDARRRGMLRDAPAEPVVMIAKMQHVNVGVIGLGNVGSGTLAVLADNAGQIALKLGFALRVTAICSRSVAAKKLP